METTYNRGSRMNERVTIAVLPHPDDELMVAQMLAHTVESGERVHVVALTDGEASTEYHLPGKLPGAEELRAQRRNEHLAGLESLKIAPYVNDDNDSMDNGSYSSETSNCLDRLELPDGGLARESSFKVAVNALVKAGARRALTGNISYRYLTLGAEGFDNHSDHVASDLAARIAARVLYQTSGTVAPVVGLSKRGDMVLPVDDTGIKRKLDIMQNHPSQFPDPYEYMKHAKSDTGDLLPGGEFYNRFFDDYGYRELFEHEVYETYDPSEPLSQSGSTSMSDCAKFSRCYAVQ